jgi:hypothetical protein
MNSRRAIIRRLILAPACAGLSVAAMISLTGCDDRSDQLKPLPGNRDDPKSQRDIEIPPGIPSSAEKPKAKGNRR